MALERLWAGWRSQYLREVVDAPHREDECLFCALAATDPDEALVVARDDHCFCVLNAYPYANGHVMVVPLRHGPDLEVLPGVEANSLMAFTQSAVTAVKVAYRPDACNVGMNLGVAAGAGVPHHLHVHVVPRWTADTNFMTTVAETRVLPEALPETLARLRAAWPGGASVEP
ncbi:MAG: HIT domain-containing protein [Actinomycetes bacterium]